MKHTLKGISAILIMMTSLQAEEITVENRERVHSVRKVVENVGKSVEKELSEVDKIRHMFEEGTVSGQVRIMYSGYDNKASGSKNTYAMAVGGVLKYELADYHGFNAAAAFSTVHDINPITGNNDAHNSGLSSEEGSYTELSQAYINYKYEDLNLRAGRQVIDTPLADSDDIRMVFNTFEAYTAQYSYENFSFMAGKLQSWQGTDAGLQEGWQETGEDGVYFANATFSNKLLDFTLWYYDFSKDENDNNANNSFYTDISIHNNLGKELFLHTNVQYLRQSEQDNSGVEADIYGALVEFVAYDFAISVAYNKSEKKTGKRSFSGYGGGTLYTSMDKAILDDIAEDRDAQALVAGIGYEYNDIGFLYAYGDFDGEADGAGRNEHIVEQDFGLEYKVNDDFTLAVIYTISKDKEHAKNDTYDWNNARIWINYNF